MKNAKSILVIASGSSGTETSGCAQIRQHLDDVSRHRWRSRQVVARGTVSVLVSDPLHADRGAIGSSVRVASLGHHARLLGVSPKLLVSSPRLHFDTILSFKTVSQVKSIT